LNTVAANLAATVNSVQTSGYTLNGTAATNMPFFVSNPGTNSTSGITAQNIALSSYVDTSSPSNINNIAASKNGDPGDGSNAIALADSLSNGSNSAVSSYQTMLASIGTNAQQAKINDQNAQLLVKQISNQRQQVSGVSLDEEASNLIRYQYQYQAAARVISVFNTVMDSLMNLIQ
jgi:flagellar hook-associated protein 1 FlgK